MTNEYYKVISGDTLSAIAKKYNTTVNALATLNRIPDINKIAIGQQIKLPSVTAIEKTAVKNSNPLITKSDTYTTSPLNSSPYKIAATNVLKSGAESKPLTITSLDEVIDYKSKTPQLSDFIDKNINYSTPSKVAEVSTSKDNSNSSKLLWSGTMGTIPLTKTMGYKNGVDFSRVVPAMQKVFSSPGLKESFKLVRGAPTASAGTNLINMAWNTPGKLLNLIKSTPSAVATGLTALTSTTAGVVAAASVLAAASVAAGYWLGDQYYKKVWGDADDDILRQSQEIFNLIKAEELKRDGGVSEVKKEKTPEQTANDLLRSDATESNKDAGIIYQKENGDVGTKETIKDEGKDTNLKMDEKPAQRERTLVLPAEQMAFDKWAASNNIQDPFRDQVTDWEKLYKENKTLADAGTLSITQSLIDKYRLTPVTVSTTTTTTPITSIKYIDGFPKSSDEMEQWVAQGRVWDPVAGKWRERSIIIQEETNDLMKTVLEEVDKRLAAGSTLTTDQQTIYDNARAALDLYTKESTSSTTTQKTTESTTDNKTEEAEIKELENLNQLTDAQLSVYTKQELRDAGMNILQAFRTYKAYADDAASKLKANPSVELDPIQKAVYNYYY